MSAAIVPAAFDALLTAHEDDAFAPGTLAEADAREAFPGPAVGVLDTAGLTDHYILPGAELPTTVGMLRAVARRDLTVAIAHGKTFLGSVPVWLAGTPEQTTALAARVRGGEAVCWGLTERGHGADLLAGELGAVARGDGDDGAVDPGNGGTGDGGSVDGGSAAGSSGNAGSAAGDSVNGVPGDGGWRLDGEKWLINNATRSGLACVLARTDPAGGARGFSLFLVDKKQLAPGSWRDLPKVRTHGIRGADISGFALDGARVGADALIGEAGDGLTVVLKSLQLTRTACASLSLGATDHALALAREFAAGRELYGRRLADIPHVRRALGRAAAAALVAEAVTLLSTRSAHALPGEMSVISALTKAYVPSLTQRTLAGIAELLGVRGFLTSPPGGGFAKLERDHRIVGIFDGSTAVNRAALLNQLPRLGRHLKKGKQDAEGVRIAADLGAELPAFDRERLALLSVGGCSAVQALPGAAEEAGAALTGRLRERLGQLALDAAEFVPVAGGLPSSAFMLAERYERAYASAACLLLWQHNPALREGALGTGALWLRACLDLLDEAEPNAELDPGKGDFEVYDALAGVLLDTPEFSLLGGLA